MRLNVRKRNGVWAVAVDEAVIQWFPVNHYTEPWADAVYFAHYIVANRGAQLAVEKELGLR